MQYQYDDIALSIVNDLNTRLLNMSFSKLVENDQSILPINEYIPTIWENKWFNDNTIAGYSIGDAVWKYTMTSAEFLSIYHELIYDYSINNPLLNGYFRYAPSAYLEEEEVKRYQNVISGYSVDEPILDEYGNKQFNNGTLCTQNIQYLPPLFDYGPYNINDDQKIEIYVSLIDNNKELLSNSMAWTNIVLSDITAFKSYISTEISLLFDKHIQDYHLGGISTNQGFSELLLKKDFSNFDISALYNTQQMVSHTQYINDQGFDFVRIFKKENITTNLHSKYMPLYRWCRLWNSGHLEHGGIIEIPKYDFISSTNASCYVISIDLSWVNNNKLLYDYQISNNFYGSTVNNLYFSNTAEIENYKLSNQLIYDNRYVVSLTPVQFNDNDLSRNTLNLIDEYNIVKTSYPATPNNDKNKSFVNYEVFGMTNNSFCITRSRTDDLANNDNIRYIQYYVSGYRSSIDLNYNMLCCSVKGIDKLYNYTGEQIKPDNFVVIANNGDILQNNIQYTVKYGENIHKTGSVEIQGISPFFGILVIRFDIRIDINTDVFKITHISSEYPFE